MPAQRAPTSAAHDDLARTENQLGATAYDVDRPALPPRAQDPHDPLIGRQIDHFEIRGRLGEGGMGTVYLAHDVSLDRPVALKVLRRDLAARGDLVTRMVQEARAQARLQHPNVVTIYFVGTNRETSYFAMEYVRGQTLADRVAEHGPLGWADALEVAIQTTRALMNAHEHGIVHRDIKPSNLLLASAPGPGGVLPEVKVADFGLAASHGASEAHFVGSPLYASPEQLAGMPPGYKSDMYALGITMHELITGAPPFSGESFREVAALHQGASRPSIAADRAPWRLRQLVVELIDPDPHKRPATYEDLLRRLESLRPKPRVAGGIVARGTALAIDLTVLAIIGQVMAGAFALSQRLANLLGFAAFGAYYVLMHRLWGRTLGKRMLGLRIQGTTRAVTAPGLALRFLVEFWGPILAVLMLYLQLGRATDLDTVKTQITSAVGVGEIPILDDSAQALLRTVFVPNLLVAIPWLAGFLSALFDRNRRALHDHAARTRVVYEMRGG